MATLGKKENSLMASVFTQILQGEIPCFKLYEDSLVFAILARDQVQRGHTLVIPKKEVDHWFDVDPTTYGHLHQVSQKLGRALRTETQCDRVLTALVGYEVKHCHLHLIPSSSVEDLNFSKAQRYPDEEMLFLAERIKARLTL
jgi:histidine triad (HIT) family protein